METGNFYFFFAAHQVELWLGEPFVPGQLAPPRGLRFLLRGGVGFTC